MSYPKFFFLIKLTPVRGSVQNLYGKIFSTMLIDSSEQSRTNSPSIRFETLLSLSQMLFKTLMNVLGCLSDIELTSDRASDFVYRHSTTLTKTSMLVTTEPYDQPTDTTL